MTSCRTCKSSRLYMFLPLGLHPLANGFLRAEQLGNGELRFPLDVHACLDCGLVQVADHVPAGYFRNYVYIPSASEVMQRHFDAYAGSVAQRFIHSPRQLTIDIGCNDGLFLKSLKDRGGRTLGVDPATNIIEMARQKGLEVVNEYFTPDVAAQIRESYGPASVIVTNNTFHHIDNLDSFMEGVVRVLADDGVFLVEVPHALELIRDNQFDGVYHEHVSQMTVKSVADLFLRFGMEVFDVEHLDVHGGSMRVCGKRSGCGGKPLPSVAEWISRESAAGLFSASTYDLFRERVEENKLALLDLLRGLKAHGKRLAGYGASARGNTLLNYYGIGTDLLDYMVDKNPLKQGLYTPGMHIPVYGVERLLEAPPDYLLIVAWNFADEIVRQQQEYRRLGGQFIVPIPRPAIVNGAGPWPAAVSQAAWS